MDLIITVCDNAAGEVCPFWPGHPATAHWGYADPSEGDGSDEEKLEAFRKTLHAIQRRLSLLISLPAESCTTPCCKAPRASCQPLIRSPPHPPPCHLTPPRQPPAPGMSVFERYLTVWVFLCIVVGIGLGQLWPGRSRPSAAWKSPRSTCPWAC
jgi:hypothetical protein